MINVPNAVTKRFLLNIIDSLRKLFEPVDVFSEILLIKIVFDNKKAYWADSSFKFWIDFRFINQILMNQNRTTIA